MNTKQQQAFQAGYRHGWYAPTHPTIPQEYQNEPYYMIGFDTARYDAHHGTPHVEVLA